MNNRSHEITVPMSIRPTSEDHTAPSQSLSDTLEATDKHLPRHWIPDGGVSSYEAPLPRRERWEVKLCGGAPLDVDRGAVWSDRVRGLRARER